jgi:Asp-tRNA(Asn)/Glu-tRNA(Gln) amidotransferase B subunit
MKKVLFLMFAMAFTTAVSAQTMPSLKADEVKTAGAQALTEQNPEMEKQIKDALMKDEGLQKEAINYLKENPETASALTKILADNKGSLDGIMKSVLGDSNLTTAAIDWISKNPEMLNKVMKIVGM